MKTYWDYSERERSELTNEQVESLLTVELMEKGVVRVDHPVLEPVDDVELSKEKYFSVLADAQWRDEAFDCLFDTIEQAEAFIALKPRKKNHDYSLGAKYDTCQVATGLKIAPVQLCRPEDVANVAIRLKNAASVKKANETALSEYNEKIKKVNEATQGVWDDFRRCRNLSRDHKKILDTFAEYVATCDGDETTAMKFLLKAYDSIAIRDAFEWFGKETPYTIEACCVAAE